MNTIIGKNITRKEAYLKVTGSAKYTNDFNRVGIYHIKLLTSPHAHAKIISIDTSKALGMIGVKKIITGNDINILCGPIIQDRPPLAKDRVRYFGEPVAMVIADCEENAKSAVSKIMVNYELLKPINSIEESLNTTILLHKDLINYKRDVEDVYPEEKTNVCNKVKIRKGDMVKGWSESAIIVEGDFSLPMCDHGAMETRTAKCEILADGTVHISSSTQAPYSIQKLISNYFNIPVGNIIVNVPLVGGAFGGKVPAQLEVLAYIASKSVDGHVVKIVNTREEDMVTSPCSIGLNSKIKIGVMKNGKIKAAEMLFYVDCGAYSETGPRMAKAIAVDCSGPYNFENIYCDVLSVYTNHPYVTSYRGFGHTSLSFCIERMMDKIASTIKIDPIELRLINGFKQEDLTPTCVKSTLNNIGNFQECLLKLKDTINWNDGQRIEEENNIIKAKGIGTFFKTSDSPTDAISSVFLNLNSDGSINLNCGAVEFGPGMRTTAAQILAEKMKMDLSKIHVKMEFDTHSVPEHWKTVASMTTFMLGRAVLRAAEDLIHQLLNVSSIVLKCPIEDLEMGEERVFMKADPNIYVEFRDIVHGYKYPNGNSIKGQILGRGSYIMSNLDILNPENGMGKAGPSWTLGAQAVEIEYDKVQHTFRILRAVTVIDAGKILNYKTSKGLLMGAMCMGLGYGTGEEFIFDSEGIVKNTSFRTYKMMRFGETPEYIINFVETPYSDSPFGSRGLAEHGIIGIPAALANAISLAAEIDITKLPINPESIWRSKMAGKHDIL